MGIIIERASVEAAEQLLRRHGLVSLGPLRAVLMLSEADWEVLLALLDPIAKEALRRWLVPLVLHAVEVGMEHRRPAPKSPPPLLNLASVARRLNVSERTVERLIAEGLLTPMWINGSRRFPPEAVEGFLKRYAIRGRASKRKRRPGS